MQAAFVIRRAVARSRIPAPSIFRRVYTSAALAETFLRDGRRR